MKNFIYFILLLIGASTLQAQVLISEDTDASAAHPEAVLELSASNHAMVLPNLVQPPANPTEGFMYYDADQHCFKGFANGQWIALAGTCQVPPTVSDLQIMGSVRVDEQVSISYTFQGPMPDNSEYTWYLATDSLGTNAQAVGYNNTFNITSQHLGYYISACVTPINNTHIGDEVCTDYVRIEAVSATGFIETFGNTTSNTFVHLHNDYDNTTLTFSSNPSESESNTATVRNTTQSNYTDASAGANVWLATNGTYLRIDGITATDLDPQVSINAGVWKGSTTANYNFNLQVEYSTDLGDTWVTLPPVTYPTTSGWGYYTFSTTVPNTITNLRFTNLTTGSGSLGLRLDDISVE